MQPDGGAGAFEGWHFLREKRVSNSYQHIAPSQRAGSGPLVSCCNQKAFDNVP